MGSLEPDLISNDCSGNIRKQNTEMSPAGGGVRLSSDGGGALAEDLLPTNDSGNNRSRNHSGELNESIEKDIDNRSKKKQNTDMSPAGGGVRPSSDGGGTLAEGLISTNNSGNKKKQSVLPSGEIEGLNDYLSLKTQTLLEKQQRTQNDPMSESFYKQFTHLRDTAPAPHIYTDEEVDAIINADKIEQQIPQQKFCGKMYFPEKSPQPGDDI